MKKLGVDTGGTFTDFVWLDPAGQLRLHKQRSTPQDPSEAIWAGIIHNEIGEETAVIHGSTVATNAILERRGAKTALITTAGFGDVLAIGRQNRPDLYALVPRKPAPLVPSQWRFEVAERVTAEGAILTPLDTADLDPIIAQLSADGIESVAICLLFAFLNPLHEQQIAEVLRAHLPHLPLSLASEILPEYREYERTSTTVLNAYVAPLMSHYLAKLAGRVAPRPLAIMQSNGGLISAAVAGAQAARTALSGPAGGVVGAKFVAEQAGYTHIITFDMGGTSTDVALVAGKLPTTAAGHIADMPLRLPMMDIHTVGAGGGSLGYVDAGGALHVGPESAGADPGPACYPPLANPRPLPVPSRTTVTDANLVLGRLDAGHFLGGQMALDGSAAQSALVELAEKMGVEGAETAAWGVLQVANAHMERAIRKISVERGHDPRQFTLVPFGGAGPLHACELAESMGIPRVLIPPTPGVLSALGMLVAAPTRAYAQTALRKITAEDEGLEGWLAEQFAPLEERARAEMAAEGHTAITLRHALDMRYAGQSHELQIELSAVSGQLSASQLFHEAHKGRYGYAQEGAVVEVVTVRLVAEAAVEPPVLPREMEEVGGGEAAVVGQKAVWFAGQPVPTMLYAREKLRAGHVLAGPALIFQYDTTIVIPPQWVVRVDGWHNLVVSKLITSSQKSFVIPNEVRNP
ncbi:MAG: hydantoinase/oxoprolinase family protein [Chloroflexi bacterium]|nr:hydantoinase/oxoprolinase family protein [Chloroflexota bacterium]